VFSDFWTTLYQPQTLQHGIYHLVLASYCTALTDKEQQRG